MNTEQHLDIIVENFSKLKNLSPCIEAIARAWIASLEQGNKIMFCGNGGSAADSQHLAAELVGRYKINRAALPAMSLTVDTSALTAKYCQCLSKSKRNGHKDHCLYRGRRRKNERNSGYMFECAV